jgi:hypothetical protein
MTARRVTWIDCPGGVRLALLPVTKGFLEVARKAALEAVLNAERAGTLDGWEQESKAALLMISKWAFVGESTIVAWEGIVKGGQPAPCNPENIRTLIHNSPQVAGTFWQAVLDMAEGGPPHG